MRGAIPVVGMLAGKTLIQADMRLADASETPLMTKTIKGSKRMNGRKHDGHGQPGAAREQGARGRPCIRDRCPNRFGFQPNRSRRAAFFDDQLGWHRWPIVSAR